MSIKRANSNISEPKQTKVLSIDEIKQTCSPVRKQVVIVQKIVLVNNQDHINEMKVTITVLDYAFEQVHETSYLKRRKISTIIGTLVKAFFPVFHLER